MGRIIALEGVRGVGKTTLLNNLKIIYPNLITIEGFKVENNLQMDIQHEFYKNQKIYINHKIEQYKNFSKYSEDILITRGSENIEMFTKRYPKIYNYNWDCEKELEKELKQLQNYRSDLIIYLNAKVETIIKRALNDKDKKRENIEKWLEIWNSEIQNWFKKYKNLIIIETDNKDSMDVAKEVRNVLINGGKNVNS